MTAGQQPATPPRRGASRSSHPPTLRQERALHRAGHRVVAGMDEVGRGALAGPVTVGVVCVTQEVGSAPPGVRDSKLLTPARRTALVEPIHAWASSWGVGHASAAEIDEWGIIAALRAAGRRALQACHLEADVVILDGKHDWLTNPAEVGLLALLDEQPAAPTVHTQIKADLSCASVAAASVLAKVERDAVMVERADAHPAYHWDINKGYASPAHLAALREFGPSTEHRQSWNLTGGRGTPHGSGRSTVEPVVLATSTMVHDGPVEVRPDGR
ncbi:Ribonuclease HII [Austwickia sp. TVS 96-490-7B]|uniref:ribonuclease HII n=1 Tax=Austwickia sp. TVS 96-490-7B TaxID=2830843 RepID=UPI001C55E242|nr:ribonuclease HII [Austwickia sp. TVS 96-490-7B]MBW3084513.1 Ribonuclease HII [Austwickia sp. TVS 96-490-7B]